MQQVLSVKARTNNNNVLLKIRFSFFSLRNVHLLAENLIGKGGYAEVYKGCLPNGQLVAIKKLTRGSQDDIIGDFLSELGIMAHVNHPNTAKLVGYGVEGGMHLVLEFSEKGSLASVLHGIILLLDNFPSTNILLFFLSELLIPSFSCI